MLSSNGYRSIDNVDLSNNGRKEGGKLSKTILVIITCLFAAGIVYYFNLFGFGGSVAPSKAAASSFNSMSINKAAVGDKISEKYAELVLRANSRNSKISSDASCTDLQNQLAAEAGQISTSKFYRYFSPSQNDYLITVYTEEVDIQGDDYRADGDAGFLWTGEIYGVTEPLYRYIKSDCEGEDHFYSTKLADYGSADWQQISGFIMAQQCSFNQPLYEYFSESNCDHYYTIDFNDLGNGNDEFEYLGVVGYVAKQ